MLEKIIVVIYRCAFVFTRFQLPYWVDWEVLLVNPPLVVDASTTNLDSATFAEVAVNNTDNVITCVPPVGIDIWTTFAMLLDVRVTAVVGNGSTYVFPTWFTVGSAEYVVGTVIYRKMIIKGISSCKRIICI